jgi:hypothetical protein
MIRWRIRKFFRSLDNYRRGFKFGYVRRCLALDHDRGRSSAVPSLQGNSRKKGTR